MDIRSVASQEIEFNRIEKMLEDCIVPRVKFGIDPTSPDVHLGHMIPILALKKLISMGCQGVIIIGDLTAQIGDPTGRDSQRNTMTHKETSANAETIKKHISTILGHGDWEFVENSMFSPTIDEMFQMLNSVTVSSMLQRSHFAKRMEEGGGITLLEMVCPLLQAWDSVKIRADLEIGGNDQLANCSQGRDMMEHWGITPQSILLFPILTGLDGRKMSKSFDNHISMNHEPNDVFGKTMSISDDLIEEWFRLIFHEQPPSKDPLENKKELALRVTGLIHGDEKAIKASEWFDSTFRKKELNPERSFEINKGSNIVDILVDSKLVSSKSEARRVISGGGIKKDSSKINSHEECIQNNCIIQKGKRTAIQIIVR